MSMRTIQLAALAFGTAFLFAAHAHAAEPDTTVAELPRRSRPTASAPT